VAGAHLREKHCGGVQGLVHPPLIEGLLLKNPKGILRVAYGEENNGLWQVRIGVPTHGVAAA
jgi:hypothetical protein